MSKVFEAADNATMKLLDQAVGQYHPELKEAGIRIALVMVSPNYNRRGDPTGPAITVAGVGVAAKIGLVSRKRRVHTPYDVEIELDSDRWDGSPTEQRLALLDHELEHITFVRSRHGNIIEEDDARPKLRLQSDDWQLTGFASVAGRHGMAALEVEALRLLWDEHGQVLFPWAEEIKPSKAAKAKSSKVA